MLSRAGWVHGLCTRAIRAVHQGAAGCCTRWDAHLCNVTLRCVFVAGDNLGHSPRSTNFNVCLWERIRSSLINNITIIMGKGGWYSLVSPFYERLGGLWRCPRNEIGDMLPGGQKCIHLVAVLLFAVTQCRFKPLQIGRRLNTQAKKKKKKKRFFSRRERGWFDESTFFQTRFDPIYMWSIRRSPQNSNSRVETMYLSIKYRYRTKSRKIISD